MTTATPEKLFEAEVKQADIDHHTPTAGAMTGHIVANLEVLSNTEKEDLNFQVKCNDDNEFLIVV
jgi:hypothetical protein